MSKKKLTAYTLFAAAVLIMLSGCNERICGDKPRIDNIPNVSGEFTVEYLKVGQADSIILKTENHAAIIDCGESDDGDKIIDALKALNINDVDYLFITHFDKDHVGGAPEFFDYTVPKSIIEADYTGSGKAYNSYIEYTEKNSVKRTPLKSDMSITLDDVLICAYPAKSEQYPEKNDNNHSIVITAVHGENRYLFAGDAEKYRLTELKKQIGDFECDIVKIPHHGSFNSYTKSFLKQFKPKNAVITSSGKNPPEEETLSALADIGCKTYLTSDGSITAVSDGKTIKITQ